jgi:hypothetical protein
MDDTAKALVILFLLGILVFFVVIGPVFTIWSLNVLFGTEIPLCFETWCGMAWLHLVISGSSIRAKKND